MSSKKKMCKSKDPLDINLVEKGLKEVDAGHYVCKKCGRVSEEKKRCCKPQKTKD